MKNQTGKFIVFYGINNLGKTTQVKLLVEALNHQGIKAEYLKYPIYDLEPSGKLLNDYLRAGNNFELSAREAQIIYVLNRTQYEKKLKNKLDAGITIIAEDYTGTGLAWGIGAGVSEDFIKYINRHLLTEDLALLFDGERFTDGIEKNHQHEQNEELTSAVRLAHLRLAKEKNWHIINANQPIEKIQKIILKKIKKLFYQDGGDLTNLIPAAYPAEEKNKVEITRINPGPGSPKILNLPPQIDLRADLESIKNTICHSREGGDPINTQEIPAFAGMAEKKTSALQVQKVTPDAKLPTRAHEEDAGLDLYADEHYSIYENEIIAIKTGIKAAIPNGQVGLIWDKSGIAFSGLHTLGGVIDSGYRGEIQVIIINFSHDVYHISKGQKIAQLLLQEIKTPDIIESSGELDDTKRGVGMCGSSGLY